ncbi:MAG: hypothetical protein HGB21_05085 [Nitrospirae bacterium]|nr:hypothetical protein [Nitrospirota bacterium]NTW65677.1 hypothetical protein [Nitrospirota bacterium]
MEQNASRTLVRNVMLEFADLTGLVSPQGAPRRYLWTDAFAVCNFLELYRQTKDEHYKRLALRLVDQVHHVLGRHRDDDPRTGWLSGLDDQEGALHPTRGGLRIGKEMNERRPDEFYDEQAEWDRDGQYYHYLTKWMHALDRVSRVTGDPLYLRWAIELARTAHARFTYATPPGHAIRMYWKMSIDLSYPLVPSMGHHDPLDGFITYLRLQAAAARTSGNSPGLDLSAEIAEMAALCEGKSWGTDDPLGIGELLSAAYRLAHLILIEGCEQTDLLDDILGSSLASLQSRASRDFLRFPARYRLAFRELGLSIGLHALEKVLGLIQQAPRDLRRKDRLLSRAERLMQYVPLRESIETNWLAPTNRQAAEWLAHRDINMVMLATSLAPEGYLSP